ncbi:MAG: hypothetical protein JWO67_38 [Streptosporangiaceae bacterium]|nr:hypothetical protein [Streptosporangiaceae bacterium]
MSATGDLIRALQQAGVSIPDQARAVGRDPSFLRQVAAGRKVGASLEGPLRALRTTGRAPGPVPYATGASGAPRRVRAPRAAGVPSVVPAAAPAATRAPITHVAGGGRITRVEIPRRDREVARQQLLKTMRDAAYAHQRLTFHVETRDGRRLTLGAKGGYQAANRARSKSRGVLAQVRDEGGDPLDWLLAQLDAAGYEVDGLGGLLAVDVVAY